MYYTFDVMGIVAFSKDFKQLEQAAEHSAIAAMHANMEIIGLLGAVPWFMHLLACIPGLSGPLEYFKAYCEDQILQRKAVRPEPELIRVAADNVIEMAV